jgi:hypothetical protein
MKYEVTEDMDTGLYTARFDNRLPFKDFANTYWRRLSISALARSTFIMGLVTMGFMILFGIQSGYLNSFAMLRITLLSPVLWSGAMVMGLIYGLTVEAIEQQIDGLLELERWRRTIKELP